MSKSESDNEFFERLARKAGLDADERAPSQFKSRMYSTLLRYQSESGPLMSLTEVHAGLCIFEKMIAVSPLSDSVKRFNPCSICHARVLAEHFERPPIYWRNCPYTGFQND